MSAKFRFTAEDAKEAVSIQRDKIERLARMVADFKQRAITHNIRARIRRWYREWCVIDDYNDFTDYDEADIPF